MIFVDTVLGRKFHGGGALCFSARSESKVGNGLGLTALLDEEKENAGEVVEFCRGSVSQLGKEIPGNRVDSIGAESKPVTA